MDVGYKNLMHLKLQKIICNAYKNVAMLQYFKFLVLFKAIIITKKQQLSQVFIVIDAGLL